MREIKPPKDIDMREATLDRYTTNERMIFLAGPIQGAEDWQSNVLQYMTNENCILANPRRDKLSNDFNYNEQVEWETRYLQLADIVLFWIPTKIEHIEGRDYAQTTRFELAEWLANSQNPRYSGKQILVGIQDGFSGKRYVKKRISDNYRHVKFYDDFPSLMNGLLETLRYIQGEKIFVEPNVEDFNNGKDYAEAMIKSHEKIFSIVEQTMDDIEKRII